MRGIGHGTVWAWSHSAIWTLACLNAHRVSSELDEAHSLRHGFATGQSSTTGISKTLMQYVSLKTFLDAICIDDADLFAKYRLNNESTVDAFPAVGDREIPSHSRANLTPRSEIADR